MKEYITHTAAIDGTDESGAEGAKATGSSLLTNIVLLIGARAALSSGPDCSRRGCPLRR